MVKAGAPALQGRPRCIVPWLNEYTLARCLNTSSSGVREGVEVNCWKTVPGRRGKGRLGAERWLLGYVFVIVVKSNACCLLVCSSKVLS